jgi:hypothetical protein
MSFGAIKRIKLDDSGKTWSGILIDLESKKEYDFKTQEGLDGVNKYDVVSYTDGGGFATDLVPNIQVKLQNFDTASPDVQADVQDLLLKMAKDKNMTDVVARKI